MDRTRAAWLARALFQCLATSRTTPVLIGDSIAASAAPRLSRQMPVANTALSGARTADFAPLRMLWRNRSIVVALGVNEARVSRAPVSEAMATYREIVGDRPAVLVGPWPVEDSPLVRSIGYDAGKARELTAAIEEFARERGSVFVRPPLSAEGLTHDGIHLTTSGIDLWVGRLLAAMQPQPSGVLHVSHHPS